MRKGWMNYNGRMDLHMTETKYYHLLSDGKTVREITWEDWLQMGREDYDRSNTRLMVRILADGDLTARKGKSYNYIPKRQLDKVLEK